MVFCRMVFAGVVGSVEYAFAPQVYELALSRHLSHSKTISFDFEAFGVMVPIVRPSAVLLSVVTGVGPGCMCPSSSNVLRIGIACLQL